MFTKQFSAVFAALTFVTTIAALGCEGCCGHAEQSDAGPAPTLDAANDSPPVEPDAQPVVDAAPDAADSDTCATDAGSDAIADAGQDSGSDAGPLPDAGSDAGQDAGPQAFGCDTWTRNASFDALRLNGATLDGVGHMGGTSTSDIYVPVGNSGGDTVAHWNGSAFALETVPNDPLASSASICASSVDDVWLSGLDETTAAGYLARRQAGTWTLDTTAPAASSFDTIWCTGADTVFVAGQTTSGTAGIWKRTSASGIWTLQTLPTIVGWTLINVYNVWAADATHAYASVVGLDSTQTVTKGIVLAYDGSFWSDLDAPSDLAYTHWVQGSSSSDLFVLGTSANSTPALYHGNGQAGGWQSVPWTSPLFSDTLIAPVAGAAIVGSTLQPETAGSGRLSIVQLDTQLRTEAIDAKAFMPYSLWQAPGTDTFFFDHISVFGTDAGFYTGTCH